VKVPSGNRIGPRARSEERRSTAALGNPEHDHRLYVRITLEIIFQLKSGGIVRIITGWPI
jgi:hypothetical protein